MSLTHIYQKSQKMMYFEVINGIWWCYQSQFRRCLLVGFQKLQNWLRREANTVERTARMFEEGTHHIEKNAVPRQTNKKKTYFLTLSLPTHIYTNYILLLNDSLSFFDSMIFIYLFVFFCVPEFKLKTKPLRTSCIHKHLNYKNWNYHS